VHEGLTSCQANDGRPKGREKIDPPQYRFDGDRWRDVIEFVAVLAGKIASADGNDVSHDDMLCREQAPDAGFDFAVTSGNSSEHRGLLERVNSSQKRWRLRLSPHLVREGAAVV